MSLVNTQSLLNSKCKRRKLNYNEPKLKTGTMKSQRKSSVSSSSSDISLKDHQKKKNLNVSLPINLDGISTPKSRPKVNSSPMDNLIMQCKKEFSQALSSDNNVFSARSSKKKKFHSIAVDIASEEDNPQEKAIAKKVVEKNATACSTSDKLSMSDEDLNCSFIIKEFNRNEFLHKTKAKKKVNHKDSLDISCDSLDGNNSGICTPKKKHIQIFENIIIKSPINNTSLNSQKDPKDLSSDENSSSNLSNFTRNDSNKVVSEDFKKLNNTPISQREFLKSDIKNRKNNIVEERKSVSLNNSSINIGTTEVITQGEKKQMNVISTDESDEDDNRTEFKPAISLHPKDKSPKSERKLIDNNAFEGDSDFSNIKRKNESPNKQRKANIAKNDASDTSTTSNEESVYTPCITQMHCHNKITSKFERKLGPNELSPKCDKQQLKNNSVVNNASSRAKLWNKSFNKGVIFENKIFSEKSSDESASAKVTSKSIINEASDSDENDKANNNASNAMKVKATTTPTKSILLSDTVDKSAAKSILLSDSDDEYSSIASKNSVVKKPNIKSTKKKIKRKSIERDSANDSNSASFLEALMNEAKKENISRNKKMIKKLPLNSSTDKKVKVAAKPTKTINENLNASINALSESSDDENNTISKDKVEEKHLANDSITCSNSVSFQESVKSYNGSTNKKKTTPVKSTLAGKKTDDASSTCFESALNLKETNKKRKIASKCTKKVMDSKSAESSKDNELETSCLDNIFEDFVKSVSEKKPVVSRNTPDKNVTLIGRKDLSKVLKIMKRPQSKNIAKDCRPLNSKKNNFDTKKYMTETIRKAIVNREWDCIPHLLQYAIEMGGNTFLGFTSETLLSYLLLHKDDIGNDELLDECYNLIYRKLRDGEEPSELSLHLDE